MPKEEPLEALSPDRAFELLAIRREKLGVEPGEAPKKAARARKTTSTTRMVKKGTTRKKVK